MMDKPNGNGLSPISRENGLKGKPPYSVETPYGFCLDLDFLKYVDDIEKGNTIKRVHIQRRSRGPRSSTLPRYLSLSGNGYRPSPWGSTGALAPRSRVLDVQQGSGSWTLDGRSLASPGGFRSRAEMEASVRAFDEQPLGEHIRPHLLRASSLPLTVLLRKGSESTEDPASLRSSRDPLEGRDASSEDVFYPLERSSDFPPGQDFSGTLRRLSEALERVGELEMEVRVVPELKAQVCILQEERERLRLGLAPRPGSQTSVNGARDPSCTTSDLKRPRQDSQSLGFPYGGDITDGDPDPGHEWRTSTDLDELLTVTSLQAKVAALEQKLHESGLELRRARALLREQQEESRRKEEELDRLTRDPGGWVRAERVAVDQEGEEMESSMGSASAVSPDHGQSVSGGLNEGDPTSINLAVAKDGEKEHDSKAPAHLPRRSMEVQMAEGLPVEEVPQGGLDPEEAAYHVKRIQRLLEQQWVLLCGGRGEEGGKAPEHHDPNVNSLQQEMMSLVHILSSCYAPGHPQHGAPKSIMKRNGGARLSKNLHFAAVDDRCVATRGGESVSEGQARESSQGHGGGGPTQANPGDVPPDVGGEGHAGGAEPMEQTDEGVDPERTDGGPATDAGGAPEKPTMTGTTHPEEQMKAGPASDTLPGQPLGRETVSGEFLAACQFLKDHMDNMDNPNDEMRRALVVLFQHWFKVAAEEDSSANRVAVYLREVRMTTPSLLPFLVNLADDNGNTALHYSVSHSNYNIVSQLLATGVCEVDLQNKAGYTAVMLASLTAPDGPGDMEVVHRLMELADINARSSQVGQSALLLAARHGRVVMVRLLLSCGADANVQDRQGTTALMCASERGYTHIARLLLDRAHCDVGLTDRRGRTALSIAQQGSHGDTASLLKAHAKARGL